MQFVYHLFVLILGSYLALNNSVAFVFDAHSPALDQPHQASHGLVTVPSTTASKAIPDILLKNVAYQNAAVIDSIDPATAPATALQALVNIYCTFTTDTYTKTTTGTGFIIDTNGVILTNAHVAQFLLLAGILGTSDCTIRTGDPAVASYKAELLYISPSWIEAHADLINQEDPKGTGERDYALLYISKALGNKPMPARFPTLPFDVNELQENSLNSPVFATGYPAEAMLTEGVNAPLVPKQATTTIAQLMTFSSDLVDIFTIHGTVIGEHGSSGGPVVDAQGKAIGLISTKGDDTAFGAGSLRAITIPYINRTIKQETGLTLQQSLGGNLPYRAQLFKQTIVPFLQQILKAQL